MGESRLKLAKREEMLLSCAGVETMAGRVQVRWETESAATTMGQLAYFSLFVRLAHPDARREAITSRPWLMSSVGRRTEHAGQTTITLTGLHAHFGKARAALMRVSALLQGWVAQATEQLKPQTVWQRVCDHLKQILASIAPPQQPRFIENNANGIG